MSNTLGKFSSLSSLAEGTVAELEATLNGSGRLGLSGLSAGLNDMTSRASARLKEAASANEPAIEASPLPMDLGPEPAALAMAAMSVPGNTDPVANAVWTVAGEEDASVVFALNFNDPDVGDSHIISFDFTGSGIMPSQVFDNGDGTYTFTPTASFGHLTQGQFAYETFFYTVTDSFGVSSTNNVTIAFEGQNDAPVASSVFAHGSALDSSVDVTLAYMDDDLWDSHTVNFYNLSTGLAADHHLIETTTANGQTIYQFAPQQDYGFLTSGQSITEGYRYVVTDAAGATSEALMMVTWTGENDIPVANAMNVAMSEDSPNVTFTLDFDDPDLGDFHTATFLQVPPVDPWINNSIVDNGNGTYTFVPGQTYDYLSAGETATVVYDYTVTDSTGGSATNQITFTITGEDDPTTLLPEYPVLVQQGTKSVAVPSTIMDYDMNEVHLVRFEGQSEFVPWGTEYILDLEAIFGPDPFRSLGQWEMAHESVSYTVQTGAGDLIAGEIRIDFMGENDAPVANDMTINVNESDGQISFALDAFDPDLLDVLTVSIDTVGGPSGPMTPGMIVTNPDGTVTFNFGNAYDYLADGQSALETFTYTITDNHGASSTATGSILIHGDNGPQVASDIYVAAHEDDAGFTTQIPLTAGTGTGDGIAFFKVIDGIRADQIVPGESANGQQINYTIPSQTNYEYLGDGQSVTEVYEYVQIENGVEGESARIFATYEGQNDAPVANDFGITISEDDTSLVFTPDFVDPDADDAHSVFFMPLGNTLDLVDNFDGTFTLTNYFDEFGYLNAAESVSQTVEYTVSDSVGFTSTGYMSITVTGADELII